MVTFTVPAHNRQQALCFRVPSLSVAFAGSRHLHLPQSVCRSLVDACAHLDFSFYVGCASGVDGCFRSALASSPAAEKTIVACAFPQRARRFSVGSLYATTVVPQGLTAKAALHRRTVWMVRRCSLLVLFPDDCETGRWGGGSTLAFRTALYNLKPVFVVTDYPPKRSEHYLLRRSSLFGVVDGWWVVPHPVEDGGTCDEQW